MNREPRWHMNINTFLGGIYCYVYNLWDPKRRYYVDVPFNMFNPNQVGIWSTERDSN